MIFPAWTGSTGDFAGSRGQHPQVFGAQEQQLLCSKTRAVWPPQQAKPVCLARSCLGRHKGKSAALWLPLRTTMVLDYIGNIETLDPLANCAAAQSAEPCKIASPVRKHPSIGQLVRTLQWRKGGYCLSCRTPVSWLLAEITPECSSCQLVHPHVLKSCFTVSASGLPCNRTNRMRHGQAGRGFCCTQSLLDFGA